MSHLVDEHQEANNEDACQDTESGHQQTPVRGHDEWGDHLFPRNCHGQRRDDQRAHLKAGQDKKALQHIQISADKGDLRAITLLGNMYKGGRGVSHDDREAVRLFRKAANKGFARSMYYLGLMYEAGRGVGKNSKIAAFHVFRSLKAGDKTVHQKQAATQGQWSKAFYLELQRLLQKEGVYSGPLDGQTGPALLKSIETLQSE